MTKHKEVIQRNNPGTKAAAAECDRVSDIINQRSGMHGDALENLGDIARRWEHYIRRKFGVEVTLKADDVAILMIEMKLSRAMYGDSQEADHARDTIGYGAIWAASIAKDPIK